MKFSTTKKTVFVDTTSVTPKVCGLLAIGSMHLATAIKMDFNGIYILANFLVKQRPQKYDFLLWREEGKNDAIVQAC